MLRQDRQYGRAAVLKFARDDRADQRCGRAVVDVDRGQPPHEAGVAVEDDDPVAACAPDKLRVVVLQDGLLRPSVLIARVLADGLRSPSCGPSYVTRVISLSSLLASRLA